MSTKTKAETAQSPQDDTHAALDVGLQDQDSGIHNQIDFNDPALTGQEAVEQNLVAQGQ